jgi:hypothetical protein
MGGGPAVVTEGAVACPAQVVEGQGCQGPSDQQDFAAPGRGVEENQTVNGAGQDRVAGPGCRDAQAAGEVV